MRLHRLKLDNWRGVEQREINFEDGVTIIEGPNEIGKTTLVEALNLLVSTLDSSRAANVKAIKPVGNDVGSRIEADIETGEFRFTYTKQFNRKTETVLEIIQPTPDQQTGREAHNRVTEILDQTMDRPLWEALLVDQGSEVSQAKLRNSQGLAQSLDEAAGAGGVGDEDPDLMEKVEEEYLRYFSPGGQSRTGSQEDRHSQSVELLIKAREALATVDEDIKRYESAEAEVYRLRETLPALQEDFNSLQTENERAASLVSKVTTHQETLEDGKQILDGLANRAADRKNLHAEITLQKAQREDLVNQLEPMETTLAGLEEGLDHAKTATETARNNVREIRTHHRLNSGDIEYWQNHEKLTRLENRLQGLEKIANEKAEIVESLRHHRVDDETLELLVDYENEVRVLQGQKDVTTTHVSIATQQAIDIEIGEEKAALSKGEEIAREVTSATRFNFPGVASISVFPPDATGELEEQFIEAVRMRDELLERLDEESLTSAQAANRTRNQSEARLKQLQHNEEQLLDGKSPDELGIRQGQISENCEAWLKNRPEEPALPSDLESTQDLQLQITHNMDRADDELENAEHQLEHIREQHNEHLEQLQASRLQRDALIDSIQENKTNLANHQEQISDEVLEQQHLDQQDRVTGLSVQFDELQAELQRTSPEAVKARYENARNALKRAERERQAVKTQVAVLKDRLDQAQANGRYEEVEAAERECEEADSELTRVTRRARAADLLFSTLKQHRDSTRRAYVAPLRKHIEELGRIVFGGDFSIDLGEDWTLQSRTLDGQTIPFNSLSVGTREQLGILTRLAVAQVVSKQGGVPLIIDDALGFSDPARLAAMGAAIAHAGQKTQILLLTCTPGRFTHVGNAQTVRLPEE